MTAGILDDRLQTHETILNIVCIFNNLDASANSKVLEVGGSDRTGAPISR